MNDGKTYDLWAGGHVVYGMCIMVANLVLLQMKNNWTGYGAGMMFLQWVFYYFSLWLDTILFDTNVIYQFNNGFLMNGRAWVANVGVFLVVMMIDPQLIKILKALKIIYCVMDDDEEACEEFGRQFLLYNKEEIKKFEDKMKIRFNKKKAAREK